MPVLDHLSPRCVSRRTLVVAGALLILAACVGDRARMTPDSAHAAHANGARAGRTDSTRTDSARTDSTRTDGARMPAATPPVVANSSAWRASARGLGGIAFGMSLDSAARVAGGTVAHPPEGSCGFVSLRDVPHGARFMVSYDTVVRVDVDSATVPTDVGARVGMREDSVQRLYANKLRVTPHKYVRGGHYLISIPGAPADTLHQLIFETDGDRVTRYRAGLVPYVSYVEGCG